MALTIPQFAAALRKAREDGEYAADMELGANADEAWATWFDSRSDAWRAALTDNMESAIRDRFVDGWQTFRQRHAIGGEPANLNGVASVSLVREALR